APRHRLRRHDESDLGGRQHFRSARTDRAHANGQASTAHRTVRALQRHWIPGWCAWRAGRVVSRDGCVLDRVDPCHVHAVHVRALRRARGYRLVLYRPLSPAIEMASEVPTAPLQQSRRLVYGLAALFGMDSFGTGFLVQSLLALWLYQSFQISVTTAAAILFWSGVCSAISYLVAVPIAKRIGLINTMVFTHLPSNVFLILIPLAPDLATAIALLLARSALSQVDVPTRTSSRIAV